MPLDRRQQRTVIGGAGIATVLLVYLLWPSGAPEQSDVELVPANQRQAAGPPAPPPVAPIALAVPPAIVPPPPPAVVPAAAPAAVPEGLKLTGVTGRGAIFGFADGGQRYVGVGSDVAPGLRLQAVQLRHVVIGSAAAAYRLGFGGPPVALAASATAPAATAAPVGASPAEAQRSTAERAQADMYRQALTPPAAGGSGTGYTLRSNANLPAFQRAGLQSGDVILSVNGSAMNAERLDELAWSIQNSTRTEFEIDRGGRRLRLAFEPNR